MTGNTTTWSPEYPSYRDWFEPANWTNGVPDKDKIAVVKQHGTSTNNRDVTVKELQVLGQGSVSLDDLTAEKVRVAQEGTLITSTVTVSKEFAFSGGYVSGRVEIPPDATLLITGSEKKAVNGRLRVRGKGVLDFEGHHLNLSNDGIEIETTGVIEVRKAAPLDGYAPVTNYGRLEVAARMQLLQGVALKNSDLGTLQISIPDQTQAQSPRITLAKDNSCYLDGTLVLVLGFEPAVGASVQVLSYAQYQREGKFAAIESVPDPWRWQANYGDTGLSVQRVL